MSLPSYTPLSLGQGLEIGVRARQAAAAEREAQQRASEEANRLNLDKQRVAEEARRNLATEGLESGRLAESQRAAMAGESEQRRRTRLSEREFESSADLGRQELAERKRAADISAGIQRGQLDISAFSAMQNALQHAENLAEEKRQAEAREGMAEREQGFKEITGTADIQLRQRAQQQAERAARVQEQQQNRQLSRQERESLFNEFYSQAKLEEQRRSSIAAESLGAATLGESVRSNQAGEALGMGRLGFDVAQETQRFGLAQRAQQEAERAARTGEGIQGRSLDIREQSEKLQHERDVARIGLEGGKLSLSQRQQQYEEFDRNLRRQVESQKISFDQAKILRDEAWKAVLRGDDLRKWEAEFNENVRQYDTSRTPLEPVNIGQSFNPQIYDPLKATAPASGQSRMSPWTLIPSSPATPQQSPRIEGQGSRGMAYGGGSGLQTSTFALPQQKAMKSPGEMADYYMSMGRYSTGEPLYTKVAQQPSYWRGTQAYGADNQPLHKIRQADGSTIWSYSEPTNPIDETRRKALEAQLREDQQSTRAQRQKLQEKQYGAELDAWKKFLEQQSSASTAAEALPGTQEASQRKELINRRSSLQNAVLRIRPFGQADRLREDQQEQVNSINKEIQRLDALLGFNPQGLSQLLQQAPGYDDLQNNMQNFATDFPYNYWSLLGRR